MLRLLIIPCARSVQIASRDAYRSFKLRIEPSIAKRAKERPSRIEELEAELDGAESSEGGEAGEGSREKVG